MLMPKKVKYRKQQRGRMIGKAWRGSDVSFGDYGLKALEPCWLTDRQIETYRRDGYLVIPRLIEGDQLAEQCKPLGTGQILLAQAEPAAAAREHGLGDFF